MAAVKKPTEAFRVPSLADADTGYAALQAKLSELRDRQGEALRESRSLEKAIAADPARDVRPSLAELLGDEPGAKSVNRKRLAEVKSLLADLEAALGVVEQRLRDAKTAASRAVCAIVRPEYARRVKAMIDAATLLDAAHKEYDDLRAQFELEDVAWGSLMPMTPAFLGDSNDPDRRIAKFIREAKEAGYA